MVEVFDCEQGSPEWLAARLGIPTASCFADVMAKGEGKTRRTYMLKLAGEILTGQPADSFTNAHMERGQEMEAEARKAYAFIHDSEPVSRVGFLRNGNYGASPDSLVGATGALEIKTKLPHLLIDVILKGKVPPEHKAQCQGVLLVSEREWIDFVAYWPGLPPFVARGFRDEPYLKTLREELDRFNRDLADMVERVRAYSINLHDMKDAA